jgi:hypothetical protein
MPVDSNKNINLIAVTSVINAYNLSIYSSDERLQQLIDKTIPSIKNKIPNSYIAVIEGSNLSEKQIKILKNSKIDSLVYVDIKNYNKSNGELSLLLNFFKSDIFNNIKKQYNIQTINKISGRYWLNDDFNFNEYDEQDCVILKKDEKTWAGGNGVCETRYYRFPYKHYDYFLNNLQKIKNHGIYVDIEHSFYKNEILPFKNIKKIDKLNVEGYFAPSGKFICD